jgi:hypothetical protein
MAFYELDPEVSPRAADMDSGVLNKLTTMFRTEVEAGKLFWGAQLACTAMANACWTSVVGLHEQVIVSQSLQRPGSCSTLRPTGSRR